LLERLHVDFVVKSPDIDETADKSETPFQQAARLAKAKAGKVADEESDAIIIGSDQLATLNDAVLGKPGNHEHAVQQLTSMSGKMVRFYTALCVLNSTTENMKSDSVIFDVYFRDLCASEIERYLHTEQPYDCVGSFKSEALGISLIEKMEGEDPSALIGLPLIRLRQMLCQEGLTIP